MDLYASKTYKEFLLSRQKALVRERPALTWKKISAQVPLQHTYLSKALHHPKAHLNEDHLFAIGRILGLGPEETEFLLLQRGYELAQDPERKKFLHGKLARFRKDKPLQAALRDPEMEKQREETDYLFDPLCVLVHAALHIPGICKDPRALCEKLGILPAQLKAVLRKLERVGFVDLGENGHQVKAVKLSKLHYGRDHPFVRVHQTMLKTLLHSQLNRTPEENKQSFQATFTMSEEGYEQIREEFQGFLRRVEQIVGKCRDEHLYQLSFDLFRWL